jgi:hypothetical protein
VRMFPNEYPAYMARTPIGIPFIARRNKIEWESVNSSD